MLKQTAIVFIANLLTIGSVLPEVSHTEETISGLGNRVFIVEGKIAGLMKKITSQVEENHSPRLAKSLKEFDRAWGLYMDSACELFVHLDPDPNDDQFVRNADDCSLILSQRRLPDLIKAHDCTIRHITDKRENEIPHCYYQILPFPINPTRELIDTLPPLNDDVQ